MNFKEVTFYKSVSLQSDHMFFDQKKEIVFVGRSNVGKSSIMNALFWKKDLVKTSSRPGKTKTANLFSVDNKYYCTDLPGYGFAKLWKDVKEHLDGLISWYLEERKENIKQVVILVDSKLGAQQTDIDMYKFLLEMEMPVCIVLSKVDKLSKSELMKSKAHASDIFFGQSLFPVSTTKKIGIGELEKYLKSVMRG